MPTLYENPTSTDVGGLTVEQLEDQLALYGNVSLTADKEGLALATELARFIADFQSKLEELEVAGSLPDKIELIPSDTVPNPF